MGEIGGGGGKGASFVCVQLLWLGGELVLVVYIILLIVVLIANLGCAPAV